MSTSGALCSVVPLVLEACATLCTSQKETPMEAMKVKKRVVADEAVQFIDGNGLEVIEHFGPSMIGVASVNVSMY